MKNRDKVSSTANESDSNHSRRSFLKATGASTVSVVALAGCSGSGDGGSDGGGNGDSGGSTGSSSDDLTEVNMVMPGTGFQGMMMDHVLEEGILEEEMSERGYTMNLQETFEGAALFASGGPDFTTMSTFEAARLSAERDLDLVSFGRLAPNFMGWWVEKGGELDPQNSGSTQNSIEQLATGSGQIGIGSWAGGHVPPDAMIVDRVYDGYAFGEGNSDFNVVTANYGAIPQLVLQGDLAAGSTSPVHGVARQLGDNGDPELTPLFNAAAILDENDYGVPLLNSLTTNQQFIDENEGACTALLQTWTRGMDWLFNNPMDKIKQSQEENLELLHLENTDQAQYLTDWGINMSLDNDYPIVYKDVAWEESTVEADKAFLSTAQDAGFIPDGYQDRLSWVQLPVE